MVVSSGSMHSARAHPRSLVIIVCYLRLDNVNKKTAHEGLQARGALCSVQHGRASDVTFHDNDGAVRAVLCRRRLHA